MINKYFVILILISIPVIFFSQDKNVKSTKFNAEQGTYREEKNNTVFTGRGNAYLEIDGNEIYSNEIEIYSVKDSKGEDKVEKAFFYGNVRIFQEKEQVQIGGERAQYYKDEKKFIVSVNAFYTDAKNEVAVFGDTITNFEIEGITVIQGNTRIYQKELFAKGASVQYIKDDEKMYISGFPTVRNKGSEYSARKIIVDVKNNTYLLKGDLQAEIINEE